MTSDEMGDGHAVVLSTLRCDVVVVVQRRQTDTPFWMAMEGDG
jgi:hypothetical protein